MRRWGTRWEWERGKQVAVFAEDSKAEREKSAVMEELEGVLEVDPIGWTGQGQC